MSQKPFEKIDIPMLYVEDETNIREAVVEMLTRRVTTLYVANNGQEGLDLFYEKEPEIVITDIRMPIMNGLDMSRHIKSYKKNIQIIVTSAHSDVNYFLDSIDIGINQYVLKPINRDKLIEAVEKSVNLINYEKKVQQQNEIIIKLYHAIEQSPSMVIIVDIDGNIMYVNPRFTQVTGFSAEEVIGRNAESLKDSSNNGEFIKNIWKALISGKSWSGELLSLKKNGETYWESAHLSPVRNSNGEITSYVQVAEDISEMKRVTEELKVSEKRYRQLVENLGEGISIVDFDENFVYANPALHNIFGVTSGNLIGRNLQEFMDSDQYDYIKMQTHARQKGEKSMYEFDIYREDGEKRAIVITATPQLNSDDTPIGTFGIFQDTTERNLLVQELNKAKDEAEHAYAIIETKNKELTDSIEYAKGIQQAIFPKVDAIKDLFPNSFVLFKTKAIVSGDFYWIAEKNGINYIAAVDCTGHGVPGAFISIVGNTLLNQAINEHNKVTPSEILEDVNTGLIKLFRKEDESVLKDGMDVALCAVDFKNLKMQFSGSFRPLYHIRNGELTQYIGNNSPTGIFTNEELKGYTNYEFEIRPNDTIYIFSDGFTDQFGGPARKKFMSKRFRETLVEVQHLTMPEQKVKLLEVFENWRGCVEQYDDVLVIGIKI